jgi:hypothetical protein
MDEREMVRGEGSSPTVTSLMFILLMTSPSSINQVYLAHNHV